MSNMSTWDKPSSSVSPSDARLKTSSSRIVSPPVKDDWEDDEDESEDDEPPNAEKNRQIWEDANTKVHHPMPDVIVARNSTATASAAHLPPPGVFQQQPAMRILKRPTSNSPSPSPNDTGTANAMESLKEREARYQAARQRIFGAGSEEAATNSGLVPSKSLSPNSAQPQVKISREPRGPNDNGSATSAGFGNNRRAKPPSAGTAGTTTPAS